MFWINRVVFLLVFAATYLSPRVTRNTTVTLQLTAAWPSVDLGQGPRGKYFYLIFNFFSSYEPKSIKGEKEIFNIITNIATNHIVKADFCSAPDILRFAQVILDLYEHLNSSF